MRTPVAVGAGMDRPLDVGIVRRRRARLGLRVVAALAVAAAVLVTLQALVEPSVRRSRIRTARVERGAVQSTLSATGLVLPSVEHQLTSPIDTRVLKILKSPGATVEAGEPILELDTGEASLAVATLDDQIALKRNEQERTRLELEATLADLARRHEIQELEVRSLQFEASRSKTLFERGLSSSDAARKAETDAERAAIVLQQLEDAIAAARRTFAARVEGLGLEMKMLLKQREAAAHVLRVASAAADRPGVLTWVVTGEGISVRRGDPLARVADLSTFRVDATVSDAHAGLLAAGMPVTVQLGEAKLAGVVRTVRPAVENGALGFDVMLDDPADARLRPNLRVDVYAVTASRANALRVPRGTFGAPDGSTWAFVVQGDRAVRTSVHLGLSSFDAFEVLEGLHEGDEVIVSDTTDILHHPEVALR